MKGIWSFVLADVKDSGDPSKDARNIFAAVVKRCKIECQYIRYFI